jgi:hypothetical protein
MSTNSAQLELDRLNAARAHLDARAAAIELQLRQHRSVAACAPAFVNVAQAPASEVELDALAAQEGV